MFSPHTKSQFLSTVFYSLLGPPYLAPAPDDFLVSLKFQKQCTMAKLRALEENPTVRAYNFKLKKPNNRVAMICLGSPGIQCSLMGASCSITKLKSTHIDPALTSHAEPKADIDLSV